MIKHETDFVSHGLNEHRFQRIQDTFFDLEDDEEESSFTRFDSLASRRARDADDVAKLLQQLNK